jgi:hypothetical protein
MSRIAPPPDLPEEEDSEDSGDEGSGRRIPSFDDKSGFAAPTKRVAKATANDKKPSDNFIPSEHYTGPKSGFTFKVRGLFFCFRNCPIQKQLKKNIASCL